MDVGRDDARRIPRYCLTAQRDCSLGVITFNRLDWTECRARIVDISVTGIGVETHQRVEPGLVWFKESVSGCKSGVVMWIKQEGPRYRAGIKFVSLSREEEAFLEQVDHTHARQPLQDPHHIMTALIESLKTEQNSI